MPHGAPALATLALATLTLVACGEGGGGGRDALPPGQVFDHPEPITEGALEILGTSDHLAEVVDLELADDGTVWLLNSAPPFFVALDARGREVASGGRQGGGPGEFGTPRGLVRLDSGLWSWDPPRGALVKVSGTDGLEAVPAMRSLPLRESRGAPMRTVIFNDILLVRARSWVAAHGGEAILPRTSAPLGVSVLHLWDAEFVAVDPEAPGGTVTPLFPTTPHLASPEEKYPGAELFLPVPLWSLCPDGTLLAYDPVRNRLVRVDASGEGLGTLPLPPAREVEATSGRLFEDLVPHMLASMPAGMAPPPEEVRAGFLAEFEEVRSQLGRVMPEYRDLACTGGMAGPGGTGETGAYAWLQLLEIGRSGTGAGGRWLRVPLSGDAEVRVFRIPDRFRPLRFTDGVAWGVTYDEFEVPYLSRLTLPATE